MPRERLARVPSWLRSLTRCLKPAALFGLSYVLHRETLSGGFVWDDRPAVMGNRDVWTDSPWRDMWRHDFWGQELTSDGSHKSFRPITTLTYRLNNILAQLLSAGGKGNTTAVSHQQAEECGDSVVQQETVPMVEMDVVRGAGPEYIDATGYHLVNVLVHAATCSCSLWVFRAVFAGEELPAATASLLFTVHPVHVEAVAPIVGRADLLCGLLSVMALFLVIARTGGSEDGGGDNGATKDDAKKDDVVGDFLAAAHRERPGSSVERPPRDRKTAPPAIESDEAANVSVPTSATHTPRSAGGNDGEEDADEGGEEEQEEEEEEEEQEEQEEREEHIAARKSKTTGISPGLDVPVATTPNPTENAPPNAPGAKIVQAKDAAPGVLTFGTALLFAAGATLCKEVGVTVFGLIAGAEVVRFFEGYEWRRPRTQRQRRPRARRKRRRPNKPATAEPQKAVRESWWRRVILRAPLAAAAARVTSAMMCAVTLVVLHIRLHEGARVKEWGMLENDISVLASRKERALSYAFTHAVYAYKLLWPANLCYDWGFRCIPHVTSLADPANLAPLVLYASILAATATAVARRDTALMWALGFVVVPFLPASNLFFPVGAIVAERLLYLPSLGACALVGCLLRSGSARRRGDGAAPPDSDGETPLAPSREKKGATSPHDNAVAQGEEEVGEEGRGGTRPLRFAGRDDSSPSVRGGKAGSDRRKGGRPSGGPAAAPFSSMPLAAKAPACSGDIIALHPARAESAEKAAEPERGPALGRISPLPAKRTVLMAVLLSWAAFFGARTQRRCKDWHSEVSLFESALDVCPDGIKTLNNVAVGMLNEEEAGHAQVLLRRAVELYPEYGFAMFNLGVSLMITRDHVGAVFALERSLELERSNTKIMVYLGQMYLELATKALEAPTARAAQGDAAGFDPHTTHHDGGTDGDGDEYASYIRSLSPESLLSSAEKYTDQALTAGSRLPMARLVKGRALALRGQHKSAAGFFQESIDISLHLLAGNNITAAGGITETSADAVDVVSTYNRLGLALKDSGVDVVAAKEAFLAGLSVAPEDMTLLINGGVAHQAAGDMPGAKALYHRALALQPNYPELLNNLGWLEEQSGGGSRSSLETAAELYARALELLDADSPAFGQVEINLRNVRKRVDGGAKTPPVSA